MFEDCRFILLSNRVFGTRISSSVAPIIELYTDKNLEISRETRIRLHFIRGAV